ncbi:hypothetical protein Glove_155g13 [Diversispora epigaea]|uniref:Uncharacterized protein n=1 Tax=Diversispora epigaea TaxID=1348612 RepID=A0A397IV00_9GLOM|nr:hypothetical protein Glove_155g13 [Diversispora epigaea]
MLHLPIYSYSRGLHDLLEEIKSGKSPDPKSLLKSNESTTSRVGSHGIGGETKVQSKQKDAIQTCIVS